MKITCIVPVYNEEPRVGYVLTQLSKVQNIDEIICVDDGSTDESINVISSFDNVTLIRTPRNQGKTGAIKLGLKNASGESILLFDADLKSIDHEEVDKNLRLAKDNSPDMMIFKRLTAPDHTKPFRPEILLTGERLIKRDHLDEVLQKDLNGFEIELALNHYFIKNDLKVYWVGSNVRNTRKHVKRGFLFGFIKDVIMFSEIFLFNNGFFKYDYMGQLFKFHPKELK